MEIREQGQNKILSPKATHRFVLLITGVAFLVRVNRLAGQSLWRDEVDAILFSSWSMPDLLTGLFKVGHNGPLYFLGLSFWRVLVGNSEYAVRYPSVILGVLAVPLGYIVGRKLGGTRRIAILMTLLLATSPYLIWYSQEAKMYTLLTALVLLAIFAWFQALTGRGRRWWVLFAVVTTLTFYTHILAPLMLGVYSMMTLLYRTEWRRQWRGWLVSMAFLTLPYLPLAWWQAPRFVRGYASGHPFYPLSDEIFLLLGLYSRGLFRFAGILPLIFPVFFLLTAVLWTRTPAAWLSFRARLAAAGWLMIPPVAVYLISRRVPVFEDRYLIYIAPAFYLLIAAGIVQIRQHTRFLAGLGLAVMLTINLSGIARQQYQTVKADFRGAAAYLAEQPVLPEHIMIHIPYLQHTFNYYYPLPYTFIEGLWSNGDRPPAEVSAEMARKLAGVDDLWLVTSEEGLWDSRGLVKAWLNENAHLLDEAGFLRVNVYHYRLIPGEIDAPVVE